MSSREPACRSAAPSQVLLACAPVLLNGRTETWVVEQGAVDIFHVCIEPGGRTGARHYLCRILPGAAVCGIGQAGAASASGLLAVGLPGTSWACLAEAAGADPACRPLRDAWMKMLAGALDLPPPEEQEAEHFHARLLAVARARRRAEEEGGQERLRRKRQAEGRAFEQALSRVAGVLAPSSAAPPPGSGDPLTDAMQMVLDAAGFRVRLRAGSDNSLEAICQQANAAWRQIALGGPDWWRQDLGPLLAFRRGSRAPLALLPWHGGYLVHDPASGVPEPLRRASAGDLADTAYAFFRCFPPRAIGFLELLRFGLVGSGADCLRLFAFGMAGGLMALAAPFATGLLIDAIIPSAERSGLLEMVALLLCAAIASASFELCRGIALLRIESRLSVAVQAALIQRLVYLPAPFFRQYAAGDLAQRVSGLESILQMLRGNMESAIFSWMFGMFSFAYLFFIDARLALLAAVLVLFSLLLTSLVNYRRLGLERRAQQAQGRIASQVLQFLNGIGKLRANGAERRAFALWAQEFSRQKTISFQALRAARALTAFDAGYVVLCALLLYAMVARQSPQLAPGSFLAFASAFSQFLGATLAMAAALTASLNAIPQYERARPILGAVPETSLRREAPGKLSGAIELNHVSFRYQADGPWALDDISLRIAAGEFVAFAGPSGSGKSTLLRLLLGFEQPQEGGIYFDGQDLAKLDAVALRRQFGVVLQNGKLMPGDIYTNIVGASRRSMDEAWEAARLAGLEQDIRAMPMGMHTVVSEGAATFSGGQKQRLLIARALVGKPRLLLFDEATSALDNPTQAQVASGIEKLQATRIVIAHRLSTIIRADRIFVIENGRLVESGNYAELMAKGGRFHELARRQQV